MNSALLAQKIAQLKQRPQANQPVLDALQRWLLEVDTFTRHLINPYQVAQMTQVKVTELVPEMLYAVELGLLDLHWEVHCPHCYMVVAAHSQLAQVQSTTVCPMCAQTFMGDFTHLVEVMFALNQEIETAHIPAVCWPPPSIKPRYLDIAPIFYQQTKASEDVLAEGVYRYNCPITFSKGTLTVTGEPTESMQVLKITQLAGPHFDPETLTARPGPIRLEVTNVGHPMSGFWVAANELPLLTETDMPPHLSGLELIHYPVYKQLFRNQVLSNRERLTITAVTTVFTDIVGSTQMYEKLGDSVAYNIVRDHFDILFQTIETHHGTVIKTIGDAVMASFISNSEALQCLIDVLAQFKTYNDSRHLEQQVHIRIGIHRGAAILVNLNDRLDYFGAAINKAARVQGIAGANEIVLSAEVYQDDGVQQLLQAAGLTNIQSQWVNLKGIEHQQLIYKIMV